MSSSQNSYLELSSNPLKFEAVSKARLNNVFYDDSNNQLFTVQAGEVTEVIVKSVVEPSSKTFRVEEKGPVISIKFSPNQRILAVQRTRTSVVQMIQLNKIDEPVNAITRLSNLLNSLLEEMDSPFENFKPSGSLEMKDLIHS